jgi:hypothetical protein
LARPPLLSKALSIKDQKEKRFSPNLYISKKRLILNFHSIPPPINPAASPGAIPKQDIHWFKNIPLINLCQSHALDFTIFLNNRFSLSTTQNL